MSVIPAPRVQIHPRIIAWIGTRRDDRILAIQAALKKARIRIMVSIRTPEDLTYLPVRGFVVDIGDSLLSAAVALAAIAHNAERSRSGPKPIVLMPHFTGGEAAAHKFRDTWLSFLGIYGYSVESPILGGTRDASREKHLIISSDPAAIVTWLLQELDNLAR